MSTSPNLMKTFIQTNFLVSQTCFKKIITQMPCCGSFLQTWELFCPKTMGAYRAKWGAPRDLRTPQDPGTPGPSKLRDLQTLPPHSQGAVGGHRTNEVNHCWYGPCKKGRFENMLIAYIEQIVWPITGFPGLCGGIIYGSYCSYEWNHVRASEWHGHIGINGHIWVSSGLPRHHTALRIRAGL